MNKFLVTRCADGRMARTGPSDRSQWVRAFRDSNLSPEAFAQVHGLRLSTLRRWITQQRPLNSAVQLQEIFCPAPPAPSPTPDWDSEVILPSGVTIRLRGDLAAKLTRMALTSSQE